MSTTSYSSFISKIHKSRNIILELLKMRGFIIEDYTGFSITEVQSMYDNKQLDMLLDDGANKKIYVKYHLATRLGESHIYEYIDDLFDIEDVLDETDDLIIVTKDKVNATIENIVEQLFIKDHKFVNIYNLNNYLFNILNHAMVPTHKILTTEETNDVKKRYNIVENSQFPEISRFDPVAKAVGLRPGEVCEVWRSSPTAIETNYYRFCY